VDCVSALVGDDGSCVGKVWLVGGVWLGVALLFGCVWMCVICVLLVVVSGGCARRGGLRRFPALKTTVVVCGCFGVGGWLSRLKCLESGAGEKVV
jgi:hypothetical protein